MSDPYTRDIVYQAIKDNNFQTLFYPHIFQIVNDLVSRLVALSVL